MKANPWDGVAESYSKTKMIEGTTSTKIITNKPKDLKGRPWVRMELTRGYVENPKDSHRELIKRKSSMKVSKKTSIYIKEILGTIFQSVTNMFGVTTTIGCNHV